MQQDLQIITKVTPNLYEHLNATSYVLFRRKKAFLSCGVGFLLLFCYLLIVYMAGEDGLAFFLFGTLLIIGTAIATFYRCSTKNIAKRLSKRALAITKNENASIRYTFYPDHLFVESSRSTVTNGYNEIQVLAETSEYYFLFISLRNAHSIKKSNLGAGNVDVFRTYMQDKTGLQFQQVKY